MIDIGSTVERLVTSKSESKDILRGDELLKMKVENIPMLFEGLIPQVGLVAEVGASDTGKSMLYRQLAICIAKGCDFLCFKYGGRYKNVIYVSTEDDSIATAYLLRRQNTKMNMTEEEAKRMRFIYTYDGLAGLIREQLDAEPADAIIIDAYSDVFNGKDTKDATQTRQFLNEYAKIAKDYNTCVAFLHHTGKRTEDLEPSKNNAVGSQSFEAKMRMVFEFRADRERSDIRHLCIVKGNYLPAEAKKSSYVLRMNDDFCFEWTGGRRPFEELAKEQFHSKAKSIDSIDDNVHIHFLKSLVTQPMTKNQMNEPIRKQFMVGDKTAREFIEYYISKGWIKDISDGKPTQRFTFALEELPF